MKKRVFEIISKAEDGDGESRAFDLCIMLLIALSVLCIILESFAEIKRYCPYCGHDLRE